VSGEEGELLLCLLTEDEKHGTPLNAITRLERNFWISRHLGTRSTGRTLSPASNPRGFRVMNERKRVKIYQ
jgi:hypothetical protein